MDYFSILVRRDGRAREGCKEKFINPLAAHGRNGVISKPVLEHSDPLNLLFGERVAFHVIIKNLNECHFLKIGSNHYAVIFNGLFLFFDPFLRCFLRIKCF
jgi:hypothetical protein